MNHGQFFDNPIYLVELAHRSRQERDLASHGDLDYSLPAYLSRSFPPSEKKAKGSVRDALPRWTSGVASARGTFLLPFGPVLWQQQASKTL